MAKQNYSNQKQFTNLDRLNQEIGRIPPQAIEIEQAVLGAIMIEPMAYIRVAHYFQDFVFYKEAHQKIIEAIKDIHDKGGTIDILTVTDRLKVKKELDEIGGAIYITQLTGNIGSAAHLDFHCRVITDKFLLRELIRIGGEMQKKAFDEEDPDVIAEWAENEILEKFDLDIEGKATFREALHSTLEDIANKAEGITTAFIASGDPELDEKISFRERYICMIAGPEGCGKTKYVTHIVKGILDNNEDAAILWFSMEDSKEQIIRSLIAMDAKLTTKQMQSINYDLSADDMNRINAAVESFRDYTIEFIDVVSNIRTIKRRSRLFTEKHEDKKIIIVIDNLGLVITDAYYRGVEKDDYLAGQLKETVDQTGASMLVLHHLTKDNARRMNLDEGYRPRKEYVKGSTRILDYSNQALLVNLPRKYKDLVAEEKDKAKIFELPSNFGKINVERFMESFWPINPKGDRNTEGISNLPNATWEALKFAVSTEFMPNGDKIKAGYIIKKYQEYILHIDDINRHREQKFHKQKLSMYTFISQKMFFEDFRPKNNSRTYYLYGDDMELCKRINELFIVESVKNRDGSDVDDESIIRYIADLNFNIFIPIINGKN